jgi:hypothetical protein
MKKKTNFYNFTILVKLLLSTSSDFTEVGKCLPFNIIKTAGKYRIYEV